MRIKPGWTGPRGCAGASYGDYKAERAWSGATFETSARAWSEMDASDAVGRVRHGVVEPPRRAEGVANDGTRETAPRLAPVQRESAREW